MLHNLTEVQLFILRRALDELQAGIDGKEQYCQAGQWPAAVGYLEGAAKAVVRDLHRVLDRIDKRMQTYPTCGEVIGHHEIDGTVLECGERLVNGICSEHGEVSARRGYSITDTPRPVDPASLPDDFEDTRDAIATAAGVPVDQLEAYRTGSLLADRLPDTWHQPADQFPRGEDERD